MRKSLGCTNRKDEVISNCLRIGHTRLTHSFGIANRPHPPICNQLEGNHELTVKNTFIECDFLKTIRRWHYIMWLIISSILCHPRKSLTLSKILAFIIVCKQSYAYPMAVWNALIISCNELLYHICLVFSQLKLNICVRCDIWPSLHRNKPNNIYSLTSCNTKTSEGISFMRDNCDDGHDRTNIYPTAAFHCNEFRPQKVNAMPVGHTILPNKIIHYKLKKFTRLPQVQVFIMEITTPVRLVFTLIPVLYQD